MQEFEESHDAALKRQGAKDALHELKMYLMYCGGQETSKDILAGLKWSVDAIDRRLSDLELTPEVGGNFPEGYFAKGGAA